jgi:hypothetical protein
LAVGLSAANTHDSVLLEPMVDVVPAVKGPRGRPGRPRKRPAKLHGDKGHGYPRCRRALRRRGICPRIARRGIEPSDKLGRHRYVVERSLAWLVGYRRLQVRYERRADILLGFCYAIRTARVGHKVAMSELGVSWSKLASCCRDIWCMRSNRSRNRRSCASL